MANGKIVYPSGEVDQVTYQFVKNYDYGHLEGYLSTDELHRSDDGTLQGYVGARKKFYELTFSYVLRAQLDALLLAWNVGGKIDLYLDGDSLAPDAIVRIMEPPEGESQAGFPAAGVYTWSFNVRFEEV